MDMKHQHNKELWEQVTFLKNYVIWEDLIKQKAKKIHDFINTNPTVNMIIGQKN